MKPSKGLIAAITLFVSGCVVFLVFMYNITVSGAINASSTTDREILTERNSQIAALLSNCESTDEWQTIIDRYEHFIIRVEDEYGRVVAKTADKKWSHLDVKVETEFTYGGTTYSVRSSVFFDRSYLTDTSYLLKLYTIAAIVSVFIMSAYGIVLYVIMLRPYRKIYYAIESFDKGTALTRSKHNSYPHRVFNKLCDMQDNILHEQANQRRIIASISHDIKTPLTSIMGYAEQLHKDSITPERRQRYLDTVYQKSVEIRDLVSDFDEYLGYSIEHSFFTEPNTTEEICDSLSKSYGDELEREGVDFKIINNAPGKVIKLDRQKMRRVVGNLVTNSLKHFGDHEKIMRVEISQKGKNIIGRFYDSGVGVEPENMEVIFEPLYTSDEGRKVAGLGLAICREIVEAHNGKIWAEKSKLGGLCICISMPAE